MCISANLHAHTIERIAMQHNFWARKWGKKRRRHAYLSRLATRGPPTKFNPWHGAFTTDRGERPAIALSACSRLRSRRLASFSVKARMSARSRTATEARPLALTRSGGYAPMSAREGRTRSPETRIQRERRGRCRSLVYEVAKNIMTVVQKTARTKNSAKAACALPVEMWCTVCAARLIIWGPAFCELAMRSSSPSDTRCFRQQTVGKYLGCFDGVG
jgi:hypothetical protein